MRNEFELDGVTYIAKPATGCTGCEFQYGHPNCQVTPECSGFTRKDGTSVIFVKKPESKLELEKEDKMQASKAKQYDVSDKSKEYWEIICDAYSKQEAEFYSIITDEWETASSRNPSFTPDWVGCDWRVKPKNRVVTLEIPEDLVVDSYSSQKYDGNYSCVIHIKGNKDTIFSIVEAFQKS